MLKPIKNKRDFSTYVKILTYLWLKWINNHELSNDSYLSYYTRKQAGIRCENIQKIRQLAIKEFNLYLDQNL
jgi:hypothetical protein